MPDVMPILPSWDFDATSEFYAQLGFAERGRWPDAYLILDHHLGIELHFFKSPKFEASSNDHGVYVRFGSADEVHSLYSAWSAADRHGGIVKTPLETDYGLLEFALLDPMRNLIRVGGLLAE